MPEGGPRLSRRRYATFALVTVASSLVGTLALFFAVDVYLHRKYENTGGVNVWGYRGPSVGRKAAGETRVAVLGGSAAFGYGHSPEESFPDVLEQLLNARAAGRRFSVVNLAYNNEPAYSFRFTMEDYAYLDYDIVILYEGYNDLGDAPRYQVFRRESPIFRLTGYLPIFPIVFKEKAWAMLHGGDISAGYREGRTVFRPGLATRTTAGALEAAAFTAKSLERQLGRLTRDLSDERTVTGNAGCRDRWRHYCGAIYDAITWARARGKGVVVGTQPYFSDGHVDQQNALAGLLEQRFDHDAGVRHVNLGRTVDLTDPDLAYDGMHLTAAGNRLIADGFAGPVMDLAVRGRRQP